MRQQNGQNGGHHRRGGRRHNNGGGNGGGGNHGGGNRGNGGGGGHRNQQVPLRNQIFDSHGPENTRVRGNAFQVYEKYMTLAREAGERIDAENYFQHAEHFYRIIEAIQEHETEQRARYQSENPGAPAPAEGGEQPPADPFAPTQGDSGLTDLAGTEQPRVAAQ